MSKSEQQIRFCTSSDGVRLAYATIGEGPPFVKAANWLSHLEFDWNSPVWRHWLTGLSRDHMLVRYDERGCGLSDWNCEDMSLEAWVRDLEAVVDAMNLERFPLLGISQGGPIAIAYAVRHPERVSHLVIYGSYLRGVERRQLTLEQREELNVVYQLIKFGWGKEHPAFRQVFTTLFIPEGSVEQLNWFNELQRISSSPENALRIVRAFSDLEVQDLAPQVTTPTLVLHATDDLRIPFAEGRRLASLIPNARFVPLNSRNHILLEGEPAWKKFLDEVRGFLGVETAELGSARPTGITRPLDSRDLDSTRMHRVREVLEKALELPTGEREGYLNQVRSDDSEVCAEVERLLRREARGSMTRKIESLLNEADDGRDDPLESMVGRMLSHYTVLEKLGEGGMGLVYKARDEVLNRTVALKMLPGYLGERRDIRRRFLQEARAAASLDHPNICPVFEIQEADENRFFIVMPCYQGETLRERISRGPLAEQTVIDLALQTARGLGHAHSAGIVHRDIKPANLFVTTQGLMKILDFGIAKIPDLRLTQSGVVVGTVAYMSPEQAAGDPVDHRSDLWSLGVVMYEALTGRHPFERDSNPALLNAIRSASEKPLTSVRSDVSGELGAIVERLMKKSPGDRFADAGELASKLAALAP